MSAFGVCVCEQYVGQTYGFINVKHASLLTLYSVTLFLVALLTIGKIKSKKMKTVKHKTMVAVKKVLFGNRLI